MILELFGAASTVLAGTIGLVLWVDARCGLDASALRTVAAMVLASVAAGALALRVTALDFALGSVAAVTLGLGCWTVVILLTTRPKPTIAPAGDEEHG
ncbi:hypothetical protein [Miltoncostaea oceani]|uniref:hypothetical protein n=1 Tax=Miltoncostaea oceani TaxID=2843216 RepID=UPI001C3D76FD|nr:hypothetical protein [Miltoncostaea oceani]